MLQEVGSSSGRVRRPGGKAARKNCIPLCRNACVEVKIPKKKLTIPSRFWKMRSAKSKTRVCKSKPLKSDSLATFLDGLRRTEQHRRQSSPVITGRHHHNHGNKQLQFLQLQPRVLLPNVAQRSNQGHGKEDVDERPAIPAEANIKRLRAQELCRASGRPTRRFRRIHPLCQRRSRQRPGGPTPTSSRQVQTLEQ